MLYVLQVLLMLWQKINEINLSSSTFNKLFYHTLLYGKTRQLPFEPQKPHPIFCSGPIRLESIISFTATIDKGIKNLSRQHEIDIYNLSPSFLEGLFFEERSGIISALIPNYPPPPIILVQLDQKLKLFYTN